MERRPRLKRRCPICGCWFIAHIRSRGHQRVCDRPECRRARHRRACTRWHKKNPGYDRDRRVRHKILRSEEEVEADPGVKADPLRRLDWQAVRDAVGVKGAAVVEETARVLVDWTREAV